MIRTLLRAITWFFLARAIIRRLAGRQTSRASSRSLSSRSADR